MTDTTLLALHRQKIVALEAEVARLRSVMEDIRPALVEIQRYNPGWYARELQALDAALLELQDREERVNRLDEVFGKWPGDEDEAALLAQLRALDTKETTDGD